jgi:hypothetical protein
MRLPVHPQQRGQRLLHRYDGHEVDIEQPRPRIGSGGSHEHALIGSFSQQSGALMGFDHANQVIEKRPALLFLSFYAPGLHHSGVTLCLPPISIKFCFLRSLLNGCMQVRAHESNPRPLHLFHPVSSCSSIELCPSEVCLDCPCCHTVTFTSPPAASTLNRDTSNVKFVYLFSSSRQVLLILCFTVELSLEPSVFSNF